MQYPPNNQPPFQQQPSTQYPPQQPWQQPLTQYPPQQPGYPQQYGQWQQPPFQPPPPRLPKKQRPWLVIAIIIFVIVAIVTIAAFANANNNNTSSSTTTATDTSSIATDTPTTIVTPTDPPFPTDTPVPTESPAQVEQHYKANTKDATVDNLDRDGNADTAKDVHFTCKILNFLKDDNGNTAGANCDNPNSYTASVVQIEFPSSTDITRLNENDIVEIWGTDEGVFSGQNAFGGTVHEVGINALYMTDATTGYHTA